ncbi:hypothetical protein G210_1888 [Candida maltosa Xu316]|uniref:Uncharacterized protein n=1 Tax=Candida maltosa (strain Xu316) TaxID=1245528 RepID=M3JXL8_CANMX|nr:hypothetical protein G210_1888 [Candida maltosa Xu316]
MYLQARKLRDLCEFMRRFEPRCHSLKVTLLQFEMDA